tara:strand:- start:2861 stop:3292 length:432 start_codon:yes stop_codon:yes gene_type:complete
MLLLYTLAALLISLTVLMLRGWQLKKKFRIPFYCLLVSSDVGNRKPKFLRKCILVGVPDALFFNPLKMRYIVGELKSRYYTGEITRYEEAQITLYMGMCNKWYLLKPSGVMLYGNGRVAPVKYNSNLFKSIFKLRFECLSIIN